MEFAGLGFFTSGSRIVLGFIIVYALGLRMVYFRVVLGLRIVDFRVSLEVVE